MEKTSILSRPQLGEMNPPPLPLPSGDTPPFMLDPPLSQMHMPPLPSLTEEENEEWSHELEPDDFPPIPPSPTEKVQDLWETEPKISLEPPLPPEPNSLPDDHDIKQLTESTMKGLEDFQWSVNEPSLKPLSNMLQSGNSNFEIPLSEEEFPELPEHNHFRSSPSPAHSSVPSMEEMLDPPSFLPPDPEMTDSNYVLEMDPPSSPQHFPPNSHAYSASRPTGPAEPLISEAQLESIIRSQVETLVEKLARKLLPEIAEKVIKQEIHRLLSE
jgi:hypothetical protein